MTSLIFDGSFQPTWTQTGGTSGPFGPYTTWNCLPQPDSLVIVPASSLPGNRPGHAGKFTVKAGAAYDCGGNQHTMIAKTISGLPGVINEAWYGWSTMLDPSWQPQGPGGWEHWGHFMERTSFTVPNTGLFLDISLSNQDVYVLNMNRWPETLILPSAEHTKNVWHDWMFHVKWALDNTGFIEVYHKNMSQLTYTMIYSLKNIATLYPNQDPGYFMNRWGIYRSSLSKSTQILYILNPKIGTARADVEYGGHAECPVLTCNITLPGE